MSYPSNWLIGAGKIFFKHRGITPVPLWLGIFIASLLMDLGDKRLTFTLIGIVSVVSGEWIRMACVKRARSITRTRSNSTGGRLIREGLYGISRNPIYLGNFLIGLGIAFFSCVTWGIVIYAAGFFIQYIPIVAFEESVLAGKFGGEYEQYKKDVPRWLGFSKQKSSAPAEDLEVYGFAKILKSESNTLAAIVGLSILMQLHYFI